ncbi:YfbM family protein [Fusobacterium canifelinum]|uniref:YfbM family protein n=1 Tax=Fusobacterium canifelinum TaxID=285729 RepID=A0ABX7CH08_9FUSO|nr:YfbM family protein [Fusobacterium canifelinum]QQS87777.1 YfbM family protein [Fusobacterium canifelinum]
MGMCAVYQEIKQEDFKKLLESDDFFETLEELEEKDGTELCDIDKMWNAIFFLLTGEPYSSEDSLFNELIFGSENFDDESEEVARYIPTERVIKISKKLNEIDFQDYLKDFDMNKFKENEIYPDIWDYTEEKEEIMKELSNSFENLKEFYNKVAENRNIAVVTIY